MNYLILFNFLFFFFFRKGIENTSINLLILLKITHVSKKYI